MLFHVYFSNEKTIQDGKQETMVVNYIVHGQNQLTSFLFPVITCSASLPGGMFLMVNLLNVVFFW